MTEERAQSAGSGSGAGSATVVLMTCIECGTDVTERDLDTDDPEGDATPGDLHDLNNP